MEQTRDTEMNPNASQHKEFQNTSVQTDISLVGFQIEICTPACGNTSSGKPAAKIYLRSDPDLPDVTWLKPSSPIDSNLAQRESSAKSNTSRNTCETDDQTYDPSRVTFGVDQEDSPFVYQTDSDMDVSVEDNNFYCTHTLTDHVKANGQTHLKMRVPHQILKDADCTEVKTRKQLQLSRITDQTDVKTRASSHHSNDLKHLDAKAVTLHQASKAVDQTGRKRRMNSQLSRQLDQTEVKTRAQQHLNVDVEEREMKTRIQSHFNGNTDTPEVERRIPSKPSTFVNETDLKTCIPSNPYREEDQKRRRSTGQLHLRIGVNDTHRFTTAQSQDVENQLGYKSSFNFVDNKSPIQLGTGSTVVSNNNCTINNHYHHYHNEHHSNACSDCPRDYDIPWSGISTSKREQTSAPTVCQTGCRDNVLCDPPLLIHPGERMPSLKDTSTENSNTTPDCSSNDSSSEPSPPSGKTYETSAAETATRHCTQDKEVSEDVIRDTVCIMDSMGKILQPGDGVWAGSRFTWDVYVGNRQIVRVEGWPSYRLVKEEISLYEPFGKVTVYGGECRLYTPRERVKRLESYLGTDFTQTGGKMRDTDFLAWVYTGMTAREAVDKGFKWRP